MPVVVQGAEVLYDAPLQVQGIEIIFDAGLQVRGLEIVLDTAPYNQTGSPWQSDCPPE